MKFYVTLFIIYSFVSCDYIASKKKGNSLQMDTLIDFTKVDSSPYFKKCAHLIDAKRIKCFEETIQVKISNILNVYSSNISTDFDELIMVMLKISDNGTLSIDSIQKSDKFSSLVPGFDSYLYKSIRKLPKVYPALKRGIPVAVQYKLPIHIISD